RKGAGAATVEQRVKTRLDVGRVRRDALLGIAEPRAAHVDLHEHVISSFHQGGERRIQMLHDRSDRGGDRVPVMTVTRCGGHGSAERRGPGQYKPPPAARWPSPAQKGPTPPPSATAARA